MDIRPMLDSDIEPISRIVLETWELDAYGEEIGYPSSECYVRSCYGGCTFSYSAVVDGEVVGCIICNTGSDMAGNEENARITEQCYSEISGLPGFSTFRSDIEIMEEGNREMRERSCIDFDGQIVLFIVSGNRRGHGYGRALYEKAIDEMAAMGCRSILIQTDSDCGYSFYDKDGCDRVCEKNVRIAFEDLHMMLYVKNIITE